MAKHGTSLEEKRVVFIVDDDPAVLHSLKFVLELEGYAVFVYRDASEVLAAATLSERGCLVVDYNLPDMNGMDMVAKLRARGITTPAVLITSDPGEALVRRAAEANIEIIEKPLLGNTLGKAIDAVFEGSRP